MEAADISSRSAVIVQCTDPYGLFDKVLPHLENRLPLRNLHWKSPSRPLRSIDSLNVTFVKEESRPNEKTSHVRRHQIPGLQQTPVVKVLLLRCDDKETYKQTVRKEAKDWTKSLGVSSESKSSSKDQERHDAFEHIILHVILPGTPAASLPKSAKHLSVEASESTDSVNSKTAWTGKSRTTVYDKIRADFHGSSKAPFERVAQVRLTEASVQASPLTSSDLEELWTEFIEKLKVAILHSFGVRVAQYEEDIRERESQRSLPGWNFCTFFVLKEGLARGFETVGLLEDALTIYEELNTGLDNMIQSRSQAGESDPTSALLPFSKDLKSTIRSVLEDSVPNTTAIRDSEKLSLQQISSLEAINFALDPKHRDYQRLILTNEASALDFRIYIFVREMHLLLRKATTKPTMSKSGITSPPLTCEYDYNRLAEICERAVAFVNFAARTLRQDLYCAWGGQEGMEEKEIRGQEIVVDNIVISWKWSSIIQILNDCGVVDSPISRTNAIDNKVASDSESSILANDPSTPVENARSEGMASSQTSQTRDSLDRPAASAGNNLVLLHTTNTRARLESWSFWSAELLSLARNTLCSLIAFRRLVPSEVAVVLPEVRTGFREVQDVGTDHKTGVLAPSLQTILSSSTLSLQVFEMLTRESYHHYRFAQKERAANNMLLDMSNMEWALKRPKIAAEWLGEVMGSGVMEVRNHLEWALLDLYTRCLACLDRPDDHLQSVLACLRSARYLSLPESQTAQLVKDFTAVAGNVSPHQKPFDDLFLVTDIDTAISHSPDQDGFTLGLSLRTRFPAAIPTEGSLTMTLSAADDSKPEMIAMSARSDLTFDKGEKKVIFKANVNTEGWFGIETLELQVGRIRFVKTFARLQTLPGLPQEASAARPRVYVYRSPLSPVVKLDVISPIDLSSARRITASVTRAQQNLDQVKLYLRPATAGLRLNIREAEMERPTGLEAPDIYSDAPSGLYLGDVHSSRGVSVLVPYSLENATIVLMTVHIELHYGTNQESFAAYFTETFASVLPVQVNVQDIFQASARYCRFSISPSTLVPISVSACEIKSRDGLSCLTPCDVATPLDVFPKAPMNWLVQIAPPRTGHASTTKELEVGLQYRCFDEMILSSVERFFLTDAETSEHVHVSRFLCNYLLKTLRSSWTGYDLEVAALTRGMSLWSFQDLHWDSILYAFDQPYRSRVEQWLRDWHLKRQTFSFQASEAPARELRLRVKIPAPPVIVTASLEVAEGMSERRLIVGHPAQAKLCVQPVQPLGEDIELGFEVTAQADTWVVGGRRKGVLTKSHGGVAVVISLIAQKSGILLLPSIDIRCRRTDPDKPTEASEVACEVDYINQAETVTVIPSLRSTTIGMGDGDIVEGHWLVESREAVVT